MSDRWVDQALPECAQWQRDLVDEELTRREARIAELEAKVDRLTARGIEDMKFRNDELKAENAKLKVSNVDYKSSMEYWVEEYNKLRSENAALKERSRAVVKAKANQEAGIHTAYHTGIAIDALAALLGASDEK